MRPSQWRPGDRASTPSGALVVLVRRNEDGTWLTQEVEAARQFADSFVIVAERDLEAAKA